MSECIGCLYDQPYDKDGCHKDPLDGDLSQGWYHACVCTRGTIERELRASAARGNEPFSHRHLSEEALKAVLYAAADRARRGASSPRHEVGEWIDAMSEAIEAAASLGL